MASALAQPALVVEPARSRTNTDGALTMQVFVDGKYHRRLAPGSSVPAMSRTSCDKPIHSSYAPVRREELSHPLCTDGCFTPYELSLADERLKKENEDAR